MGFSIDWDWTGRWWISASQHTKGGQVQLATLIQFMRRWCVRTQQLMLINGGHGGHPTPCSLPLSPAPPLPPTSAACLPAHPTKGRKYGNDHIVCGRTAKMWPCYANTRSTAVADIYFLVVPWPVRRPSSCCCWWCSAVFVI